MDAKSNQIFYRLIGFQSQVLESSEKAELALQTVPEIQNQIHEAERTVAEAENVRTVCFVKLMVNLKLIYQFLI